jgi:hypothetical protein
VFYIVRVWEPDGVNDYEYNSQEDAQAHMQTTEYHAEMYVWLAGREWFMSSAN